MLVDTTATAVIRFTGHLGCMTLWLVLGQLHSHFVRVLCEVFIELGDAHVRDPFGDIGRAPHSTLA